MSLSSSLRNFFTSACWHLIQTKLAESLKIILERSLLKALYESVMIPALGLAEQDRHRYALEENVSQFVYQSTRELIEDLGDRFAIKDAKEKSDHDSPEVLHHFGDSPIVCIPARDEADELVGMMLCQLLQSAGFNANYMPIGTVEDMLNRVSRLEARIVCISALPPFAVGQARSLCRRLRGRFPDITVVLSLWSFAGGVPLAQDRIGQSCSAAIATTLAEAQIHLRRLIESSREYSS